MPHTKMPRLIHRDLFTIALLTLVAFSLRVADLTARSLWLDEGFTLIRIFGSWSDLLRNVVPYDGFLTIDTNPQAYFALLKLWTTLTGSSELALKWLSAAAGSACVPLIFVTSRRLVSRPTALIATLLLALSPVVQWYSHELRMYTLVVCLATLSIYLLHRALTSRTRARLSFALAWIGCAAVCLLTHYSFIGLVVAEFGYAIVWLALRRDVLSPHLRRQIVVPVAFAGVLAAMGVSVVVGAPALVQRLAGGAEYSFAFVPLNTVVQSIVGQTLFGLNTTDPTGAAFTWLVFAVCAVGTATRMIFEPQRRAGLALLAVCATVPVLVWFGISLVKPNFHNVRHLILVVPAFMALLASLLASMIEGLWLQAQVGKRVSGLIAVTMLMSVMAAQLYGLWFTFARTDDWQDDWRTLTQYLRDHWQSGDAIVENAGTPPSITRLYLGDLPAVPQRLAMFKGQPPAEVTRRFASDFSRIWFINTGSRPLAEGEGRDYLRDFTQIDRIGFQGRTIGLEVLLLKTAAPFVPTLPVTTTRVESTGAAPTAFPRLAAYDITAGNPYATHSNFKLTLYWEHAPDATGFGDATVTVRLTQDTRDGQVWLDQTFRAQAEHVAVNAWPPSMFYVTDALVPVPPGLPVQQYFIELIVRAGAKNETVQSIGQSLPMQALTCCVRIANVGVDSVRWQTADIALAVAEYPNAIKPGESLPVALTWRTPPRSPPPWQTEIKLEGLLGGEVTSAKRDTIAQTWPTGELARDQLALTVPYSAQVGWYRLSLNRYRDGRFVDGTLLGLVQIEDYPRTPIATTIQQTVNATVGEMTLLGISTQGDFARDNTLDVITHWRVDARPKRDGVLFLHIIGPDGKPIPGDDNPPFARTGSPRSTLSFRAGDGIDQVHRITLASDLPAGDYTLLVGVYDREGEHARWPAKQDGQPARDDLVKVGSFTLR